MSPPKKKLYAEILTPKGFSSWGFGEVNTHDGGVFMNKISPLIKDVSQNSLPSCHDTMRSLHPRQKLQIHQHPDLELLTYRTVKKQISVVSYPVCDILL